MLPNQFQKIDAASMPRLQRWVGDTDTTQFGAYPHGTALTFKVDAPRSLGAAAVVLRIAPDGGESRDIPLTFFSTEKGVDHYAVTLQTGGLCSESGGLFYYEFLFVRGQHTLFTQSIDNLEFRLSPHSERRFRLLIHRADFHTPKWFREGTMYHVFLDRFCCGKGKVTLRPGAREESDWENGIPQFAEKNGDPLSNDLFFGGNLWGVAEQLDHLRDMGITVLYLSPIFEAASNHRYDTADYERIDAYLGGEEAFAHLIREAHARDMRVVLDGVFNHTGDDSRYFNRYGTYPEVGAFQSKCSLYRDWYRFDDETGEYESWWGIEILPRLNHENPACRRYFTSSNGIAAKWLRLGADGWRLDVADELSDAFLDELRQTVKETSRGEAVIIGEVWENAADKIAYGQRRRYFRGDQLDSVMNYPFRTAVLELLRDGNTEGFVHALNELYASYPKEVSDSLMNLLGTHDTERILTLLGDESGGKGLSNAELSVKRLTPAQRRHATRLLKLASTLQFTVYGIPSVYYGDEAGLEGYHDPFCRMPYPHGRESAELMRHYRMLGNLRRSHKALQGGSFRFLFHGHQSFLYERAAGEDRVLVAVNLGTEKRSFSVDGEWKELISGETLRECCCLAAGSFALLVRP